MNNYFELRFLPVYVYLLIILLLNIFILFYCLKYFTEHVILGAIN